MPEAKHETYVVEGPKQGFTEVFNKLASVVDAVYSDKDYKLLSREDNKLVIKCDPSTREALGDAFPSLSFTHRPTP
jgi:hypothetical protein